MESRKLRLIKDKREHNKMSEEFNDFTATLTLTLDPFSGQGGACAAAGNCAEAGGGWLGRQVCSPWKKNRWWTILQNR